MLMTLGCDANNARASVALNPPTRDVELEQRVSERTAKVRAPLGEIDANPSEYTPLLARCCEIDAECGQFPFAEPGDGEITSVRREPPGFEHCLEQLDCHLTGQMPVTGARVKKLYWNGRRRQRSRWRPQLGRGAERGHAFDYSGNVRGRDPEIAMAPPRLGDEQFTRDQLSEMRARRLRGDIRGVCELSGRARCAVDEGPEDPGPGGICEETRDLIDFCRVVHISLLH